MTAQEALSGLLAAIRRDPGTPPDGFYTATEWAALWGCAESTARIRIRQGIAAGCWGKAIVQLPRGVGLYPTAVYGPRERKGKSK